MVGGRTAWFTGSVLLEISMLDIYPGVIPIKQIQHLTVSLTPPAALCLPVEKNPTPKPRKW